MPATGLKIVGTGACLPWCSISSSFQNSLKTSGHRGYEFLEFWCWNLAPFLPDIGFHLLKSLWSSLTYFSFNDAPNVLYRWKIWTAGRPIQHPDSSTTKSCCCHSCSMWFALSCWNTPGLPWNRRHLERSICCSKNFIYLSAWATLGGGGSRGGGCPPPPPPWYRQSWNLWCQPRPGCTGY